jgi:hypothetical protein
VCQQTCKASLAFLMFLICIFDLKTPANWQQVSKKINKHKSMLQRLAV